MPQIYSLLWRFVAAAGLVSWLIWQEAGSA